MKLTGGKVATFVVLIALVTFIAIVTRRSLWKVQAKKSWIYSVLSIICALLIGMFYNYIIDDHSLVTNDDTASNNSAILKKVQNEINDLKPRLSNNHLADTTVQKRLQFLKLLEKALKSSPEHYHQPVLFNVVHKYDDSYTMDDNEQFFRLNADAQLAKVYEVLEQIPENDETISEFASNIRMYY